MKRIELLLLSLLVLFCVSCEKKSQNQQLITEINNAVEKINSQCPIYYDEGNGVTLLNVKYENNAVIYDYKVDRISDEFTSNLDNFKTGMIYMLKGEADMSPESKTFYSNIIETEGKLIYKYHTESGKSFSIEISNDEIKNAFK